jgi:hypothetical protein
MKNLIKITLFLFALISVCTVLQAQITITSADASAINAVGNILTNHSDTTTTSINIGAPGATSWDFSALKSHFTTSFTSVLPSSTPYYSSDFPGSNVVFSYQVLIDADTANGWQYSTQNPGDQLMNGVVVKAQIGMDIFLAKSAYSPAQPYLKLPFTYNSQWNSSFTITNVDYFNSIPFITRVANHTETVVADAWGNMTLPGGVVLQAIRLRRDDRYRSPSPPFYVRTIAYSFLTKSGAVVEISAADTSALNSGIIQTNGVTWSNKNVPLGNDDQISSLYSLKQNYPNPFNETTKIRYETGSRQLVSLKVYDLFGKEIKILVNEEQPAGIYEVDFDGAEIASGTYVIELKAGLFKVTKKMILMK